MAFVVVEFSEESGGGVAIVNSCWLTPRKKEAFWPPIKQQNVFDKALKNGDAPQESWETVKIQRVFYETGE